MKDASMAFCNEKEQLYLETDMLGVGLGASLLQVRDRMWLSKNEAPENTGLCPIPLASKRLTSAETW